MRRHLRLALATALLVSGAGTSTARARQPAGLPRLAGSVTVTARSTAAVRVATDVPLRFSFDPSHHQAERRITGRGRVVGAALVSLVTHEWVSLTKIGFCDRPGCQSAAVPPYGPYKGAFSSQVWPDFYSPSWSVDTETAEVILAPGVYDLVVLTDGGPVTVVFPFRGARGSIHLTATEPRRGWIGSTLAPSIAGSAFVGPEVHLGQEVVATGPYGRIGMEMTWILAQNDPAAVPNHVGWACAYPGGVATGAVDPFQPGCPATPARTDTLADLELCRSWVPGGYADELVGTPLVLGGFVFLMMGCLIQVPRGDRLAVGVGSVSTANAAGAFGWSVED